MYSRSDVNFRRTREQGLCNDSAIFTRNLQCRSASGLFRFMTPTCPGYPKHLGPFLVDKKTSYVVDFNGLKVDHHGQGSIINHVASWRSSGQPEYSNHICPSSVVSYFCSYRNYTLSERRLPTSIGISRPQMNSRSDMHANKCYPTRNK